MFCPKVFLMEMMDINEALMDLQFDPDPVKLASLKDDVNGVEKGLSDEILSLTTSFEGQTSAEQDKTLIAIKDLYYRTKYLLRLRESIAKAANL